MTTTEKGLNDSGLSRVWGKIKALTTPLENAVQEIEDTKANIDGCYEGLTSGMAFGLITDSMVEDKEPYNYRSLANLNVGRFCEDTLVGGSVVWNQLIPADKKSGTITPVASANSYYSSSVVTSGAITDHVYFMRASFNYKGDKTVTGFLQAGNLPAIAYSSALTKNTNTSFSAVLKKVTGAGASFVIGISTVDHSIKLDDTDVWDYDYLYTIDLTLLFGSTIADYIYSLETATAGAGVAWVRKYFPKEYFEYCEPHFEHVQTSQKTTVGFNVFDEEVEQGYINVNTGQNDPDSGRYRSKNHIRVLPNTVYYFKNSAHAVSSSVIYRLYFYDENKAFIGSPQGASISTTFTTPVNCHYVRFFVNEALSNYNHDICINIHGDRDGEYEPYRKRTYPIEPKVLRGIPKLDASNRLCFDGDVMRHDGSVERRWGEVDLGEYNYAKHEPDADYPYGYFYCTIPNKKYGVTNLAVEGYVTYSTYASQHGENGNMTVTGSVSAGNVSLINSQYASYTIAQIKTAMSGVKLLYELATPTTETAEPFQSPMVVDPLGTEEFIDYGVEEGTRDVAIPVGHDSTYPEDLVKKTEKMPSPTGTNGDYVITEVDGKLYLKPYVPAVGLTAPTNEGEGE
jgi:hypothetical protein